MTFHVQPIGNGSQSEPVKNPAHDPWRCTCQDCLVAR